MKKIIGIVCVIVLLAACAATVYFGSGGYSVRVAHANLYSDKGYIDYAKEVYFDVEAHPELAEQGLFWAQWNESENKVDLLHADSEEGAAVIDPDKPTIINVHGVLMGGNKEPEMFNLNSKVNRAEDFGMEGEDASMLYLWMQKGWNVGVFHYNKFAADLPNIIEGKIWSGKTKTGVRYKTSDDKYSDPYFTPYTLAEHFAAEYVRAMKLLPQTMGDNEIRIAAHSMGGQLATAGIFLLTELAEAKQLPHNQLPDRYALLDAFFSVKMVSGDLLIKIGIKDTNLRWSGKPLPGNSTGYTMIECLKVMKANGIALEYYVYEESFLKLSMLELIEDLRALCPYTVVLPDYNNINSEYTLTMDGHNGVREWYMVSMLSDPIKDITEGRDSGELAPSAAMDTETLKTLVNKAYTVVEGAQTPTTADDAMVRRYSIYYELNEGVNGANPDYYTKLSPEITLKPAKRTGYTFKGWYATPDFSGERIETINPAEKKDIKLYAKWS
jgi:uncharacterized repeat protein (TIGR02543 family)